MHSERVIGIIPARLRSERLPRKPLHLLAGRPLLEWVWRRVSTFQIFDEVVVATDSPEIERMCVSFGARVELTSPEHPSGTDRIAEVMERSAYHGYDLVVNVQGDEPFVTEEQVMAALSGVRGGSDIGTVATPVRTLEELHDPSVVKVVRREDGTALYFSRAPIPHERSGDIDAEALVSERYLRHSGVYAYTRASLRKWVSLPPGELEQIERLEQLRPLAAGMSIGVGVVANAEHGVDTAADAVRAEEQLRLLEPAKRDLEPAKRDLSLYVD
ncbi:MAG: 3-deoxy-manno-octulosonate cytidylyltransferase [Longimicrobiales bacterium]